MLQIHRFIIIIIVCITIPLRISCIHTFLLWVSDWKWVKVNGPNKVFSLNAYGNNIPIHIRIYIFILTCGRAVDHANDAFALPADLPVIEGPYPHGHLHGRHPALSCAIHNNSLKHQVYRKIQNVYLCYYTGLLALLNWRSIKYHGKLRSANSFWTFGIPISNWLITINLKLVFSREKKYSISMFRAMMKQKQLRGYSNYI